MKRTKFFTKKKTEQKKKKKKKEQVKEKPFELHKYNIHKSYPDLIHDYIIFNTTGNEQKLFYYIVRMTLGFYDPKDRSYKFFYNWHGNAEVADRIKLKSSSNMSALLTRLKDKHAIIEWELGFNKRWFCVNPGILRCEDLEATALKIKREIQPHYKKRIRKDGSFPDDDRFKIETKAEKRMLEDLKKAHLKMYEDYEFTKTDIKTGFPATAKMLCEADEDPEEYVDWMLGRTGAEWENYPHGGNYMKRDSFKEFLERYE